jgi:glycosyltransferase involved in cell wall biosynthesis
VRGRDTADRIETSTSAYLAARRLGVRFDVVEYPDWGAEGLLFALTRRLPRVAYLHTPIDAIRQFNDVAMAADARCASRLERAAVRRADRIIAPSRMLADHLSRSGWLGGRSVEIIPYGIDGAAWSDVASVVETGPTVLFLGRLEARKAPETVVRAVARLRREIPEVTAVFVGNSGGERDGLEYAEWCRRLEGGDACVFVAHTPPPGVVPFMSAARVLALPSRFDNFPMVVLEAMASGRPVVVSSMVGMAPAIASASAGVVVPPGDSEVLAGALRPFLASTAQARVTGENGRRLAREAFEPSRIAAERERVYRGAIGTFNQRR